MRNWKAWIGLAIVFFSGVAIGAVGGKYYAHRMHRPPFEDHKKMQEFIIQRFNKELDLTEKQQKIVRPIIVTMDENIKGEFDKTKKYIFRFLDQAQKDMAQHLNSEQKEKLAKMIENIKTHPGPPGPPPPPPND